MTSILHFADIHFGVEDQAALAKIDAVIEKLEPDVSVVSGDITQTGSAAEFKQAARWIENLSGPKIICAGNHDTPMYGLLDRLIRPFARYNHYIAPLDVGLFEDDHVVIQSMNTARGVQLGFDWSLGIVDLTRLDECIEEFQSRDARKLRFLNVHHPFIYPPESPLQKTTKKGPEGLQRLADGQCDAVLSGHIHVPFVIERQPGHSRLLSISSGTLSTRRRDNHPAFNHIQVDEEEVVLTMIEFSGDKFIRSEKFRERREALLARRNPSGATQRHDAAVLNTQQIK